MVSNRDLRSGLRHHRLIGSRIFICVIISASLTDKYRSWFETVVGKIET